MREITVKVYKFDELNEDTKAKVLEKHRNINVDTDDWCECTTDDWKGKLAEKGFQDAEIRFSGFWSQGDGACFDAVVDASRLAAAVYDGKDEGFYREVLQLFTDNGPQIIVRIEKNSYGHHYSHARTRYILVDKEFFEECEYDRILSADLTQVPTMISGYDLWVDEDVRRILNGLVALRLKYKAPAIGLDELLSRFEKDADSLRENLSNEIYRDLEKDYESLTSDESVSETLKINDYEFDEDGEMV
jgi:hypothetical protein